jgi:hypothetical protein
MVLPEQCSEGTGDLRALLRHTGLGIIMSKAAGLSSGERILFPVSVCFILAVPISIGLFFHAISVAWLAALCGAFVLLVSRLETLAELSLGPLKAKMRQTIAEAAATVDQLRDIATPMISAFLIDLISGSFMGGISNERRLQLHDELIDKLKALGATEEQLRKAEDGWRKGINVLFHRIIRNQIVEAARPSTTANQLASEVRTLLDFDNWSVADPKSFEELARKHQVLTPQVQSWIDDYRHFLVANEIRRRDEFVRG